MLELTINAKEEIKFLETVKERIIDWENEACILLENRIDELKKASIDYTDMIQKDLTKERLAMLENHDCKLSSDSSCSACEEAYYLKHPNVTFA